MTQTEAQTMTGTERAMALDLLDESPITHLTEDENPWFDFENAREWDGTWATDYDEDEDFFHGLSVHNNG